ncbi:MAG TPA: hypothetical protein VGG04_04095 [Candidatus Sulfotelmatobacter sp.]|jgi:hypothetical protein
MPASAASDRNSGRNTAAISLVIVCCLLSVARLATTAPNPAHLSADTVAQRSDQRFAALKSALPDRGIIGYIGEPGDAGLPDYYLTQYALAPRVIERSTNHALVIGNFPARPAAIPAGLQLVSDFGDGVLLFYNKEAR